MGYSALRHHLRDVGVATEVLEARRGVPEDLRIGLTRLEQRLQLRLGVGGLDHVAGVDEVGLDPVDDLLHLLRVLVVLAQLGGQGQQEAARADVTAAGGMVTLPLRRGSARSMNFVIQGCVSLLYMSAMKDAAWNASDVGHVLEAGQQQVLVGHEARGQEVLRQALGQRRPPSSSPRPP